jgi:hypothetical protein
MNPFEQIADFGFALEMAKHQYPDIAYAATSRATFG